MLFLSILLSFEISACRVTTHPVERAATTGMVKSFEMKPRSSPVSLGFSKITSADWLVARDGLLNFSDPKVIEAGLSNELEEIQIYLYIIDHPEQGRFLIDTGVSQSIAHDDEHSPIPDLVKPWIHYDKLKVYQSTNDIVAKAKPIQGVFLTHLHADHIMGMQDISKETPIYIGPGEAAAKSLQNLLSQNLTDALLSGHSPLRELSFATAQDPQSQWLDFFGDASLQILWVPGHTPGSLAFLIQTAEGYQLVTGDTCHTAWGWTHRVTPGTFTADHTLNQQSLDWLVDVAAKTNAQVHLGHQSL